MALALTQNNEPYAAAKGPNRRSRSHIKLYARHRYVLELKLAGLTHEEISELSGYSVGTIGVILRRDDVQAIRQDIMREYEQSFEDLFPLVIEKTRALLRSEDPDTYDKGIRIWLRELGPKAKTQAKLAQNGGVTVNLTAEDVVFQILNQRSEASCDGSEASLHSTHHSTHHTSIDVCEANEEV